MLSEIKVPQDNEVYAGEVHIGEYVWQSAAAFDHGPTEFSLDFDHEILDVDEIDNLRGVLLTIPDERAGPWYGIQKGKLGHDGNNWTLSCVQISALFQHMIVGGSGDVVLTNLPPGLVVKRALEIGLSEMPGVPFRLGNFCESMPFVDQYTFNGQTVEDVIGDMMKFSGQEWYIDNELLIHWVPAVGAPYANVLTEGFDFDLLSYEEAEEEPVRKVVVIDQNKIIATAEAPEHKLNMTAKVIYERLDTSSNIETQRHADSLLAFGRIVPIIYEIGLRNHRGSINILYEGSDDLGELSGTAEGETLSGTTAGETLFGGETTPEPDFTATYPTDVTPTWAIREGDIVSLVSPYGGLRGSSPVCRVISKKYGDDHPMPVLRLITIEPWTQETISAYSDIRNTYAYTTPPTLEQIIVNQAWAQRHNVIAAAQIATLTATQVPEISALNGAATPTQLPPLQDLSGAVTPAQIPSGGAVADAAGATPTQAEFNALTAALRVNGSIS